MTPAAETPSIDVWFLPPGLESAEPHFLETLSARERERARAFRFDRDRDRFIVSHRFLRKVLAGYRGRSQAPLTFAEGPYGKPFLTGTSRNIEFNMSHSGGSSLVGVTRGLSCGVDIERSRDGVSVSEIAARFFSTEESQRIDSLNAGEKVPEFFRIWTIKEAIIKATGWGLSLPLNEVSVPAEAVSSALQVRVGGEDRTFWYTSLNLHPGFHAAVALEGSSGRVVRRS